MSGITCWNNIWNVRVGDYELSLSVRDREREREFAEQARRQRPTCPNCPNGKMRVSDAIYADCDNCDTTVPRDEVGL